MTSNEIEVLLENPESWNPNPNDLGGIFDTLKMAALLAIPSAPSYRWGRVFDLAAKVVGVGLEQRVMVVCAITDTKLCAPKNRPGSIGQSARTVLLSLRDANSIADQIFSLGRNPTREDVLCAIEQYKKSVQIMAALGVHPGEIVNHRLGRPLVKFEPDELVTEVLDNTKDRDLIAGMADGKVWPIVVTINTSSMMNRTPSQYVTKLRFEDAVMAGRFCKAVQAGEVYMAYEEFNNKKYFNLIPFASFDVGNKEKMDEELTQRGF